jgi:hypothetical protein
VNRGMQGRDAHVRFRNGCCRPLSVPVVEQRLDFVFVEFGNFL